MIYKIGNTADLLTLLPIDISIRRRIHYLAKMASVLYDEERKVDTDNGGYVLYAEQGIAPEKLRKVFDYTVHTVESKYHTEGNKRKRRV